MGLRTFKRSAATGKIASLIDAANAGRVAGTTEVDGEKETPVEVLIDVVTFVGSLGEVVKQFDLLKIKETKRLVTDVILVSHDVEVQSGTAELLFDSLKVFPNPVVRNIAKAAGSAANLTAEQAELIRKTAYETQNHITDLETYLKYLERVSLVAESLGVILDIIDVIEEEELTWGTVLDQFIDDFDYGSVGDGVIVGDAAGDDPVPQAGDGSDEETPDDRPINLPVADAYQNIEGDVEAAMAAFGARTDFRREQIEAVTSKMEEIADFVLSLVPDADDPLAFLEDQMQSTADTVNAAFDALSLDELDKLGDILDPVTDALGVLEVVRKAVQPVIDFFGPVVSLINKAIGKIESALGLDTLKKAIEDAIGEAIDTITKPIRDEVEAFVETITDNILAELDELFREITALRDQLAELILNPVAVTRPNDGTSDLLEGRSILAAGDGDDVVNLALDPRFDADGYGGMALGGAGNDLLRGTERADVINGGDGDDLIFGFGGNDQLFGGDGNNIVEGGAGDDALIGGIDADRLVGGTGDDAMYGDAGSDVLLGGDGNDVLDGEASDDTLRDGAGDDIMFGGAGDDAIFATAGTNLIDGGEGLDTIVTIGAADAHHTITDSSVDLNGGSGVDLLILGDDLAHGAIVLAGTAFDGGGNKDVVEAGDLDLAAYSGLFTNFETLSIRADMATDTAVVQLTEIDLAPFDVLKLSGDGAVRIEVTSGDFVADALGASNPIVFDLTGLSGVQNPQDGPSAGQDAQPTSTFSRLTLALTGTAGLLSGPAAATAGIRFEGSSGDDTIIGGGGSDIIVGGLGADIMDGGRTDGGDRFIFDGAVGDVFLGTPEELDGDLIRNLSNRVDRVRLTGSDSYEIGFEVGDGATVVSVWTDEAARSAGDDPLATFTLDGTFPKLATRSVVGDGVSAPFVDIFNNNVPPSATPERYETTHIGAGAESLEIDPFANDYDADTGWDDGTVRRQIALDESVALLFRLVDAGDEQAWRDAFTAGQIPIADGDILVTDAGNTLYVERDESTGYRIIYSAYEPYLALRRFEGSDPITGHAAAADDNFDVTEDLPFFGTDSVIYQVFDPEGELSNTTTIDFLIRPEVRLADGSTVLPSVTVQEWVRTTGDDFGPVSNSVVATLTYQDGPEGSRRISYTSDANESLATVTQGNDYFDIAGGDIAQFAQNVALYADTYGLTPDVYAVYGFSGNDVIDARGIGLDLALLGGNNADWVEGGTGSDFLTGGGIDDEIIDPSLRIDVDGAAPPDADAMPNILLGGPGRNVYSASLDFPDDVGIPNVFTRSRETHYRLDPDGEDVITGPMVTVGQRDAANATINILPDYGPAALTAAALDGDTIAGFDANDRILLPMSTAPLDDMTDSSSDYLTLGRDDGTGFDVFVIDEYAVEKPVIVQQIDPDLPGSALLDLLDIPRMEPVALPEPSQTGFYNVYDYRIEAVEPFVLTYSTEVEARLDAGPGSPSATAVTVTIRAWEVVEDTIINTGLPGAADGSVKLRRSVVEADHLIDPGDLDGAPGLTFTTEFEGVYGDKFAVELADVVELDLAPFLRIEPELGDEYVSGGYQRIDLDIDEVSTPYLGFTLKYVSRPPEVLTDSATVRRGEAVAIDVFANDFDSDYDQLAIFDLVFETEADDRRLLDGNVSNGEILLETDPETGLGTGRITYVADASFIGDVRFSYIATDGEFRSDPTQVTITQTGLPPALSDDIIVLPADAVAGATIDFATILANDGDPDGDPLLPGNLSVTGATVSGGGIVLDAAALAASAADPVAPGGDGGTPLRLSYTVEDAAGAGTSDPATIAVYLAEPLLLDDISRTSNEDEPLAIDLLSLRSGGYADLTVTAVTAPVVAGTDVPAGEVDVDGDEVIFTPAADLSQVTVTFNVDVIDAAGDTATSTVSVELLPVEDAPELTLIGADAGASALSAVEDTPRAGTLLFSDADGEIPVPASADAIATRLGGTLTLTATAAPGAYQFLYTPAPDLSGPDVAEIALSDGTTLALDITISAVNDAPALEEDDLTVTIAPGEDYEVSPLESFVDVDGELDPDSLQVTGGGATVELTLNQTEAGPRLLIEGLAAGVATVVYSVADDQGLRSASRSITIEVNSPPETATDEVELLDPATPILIDAIANDSDPDGPTTLDYVRDENGVPLIIAPDASSGASTAGLLGSVVWSSADAAFLYTPPDDVSLFGQSDVFFYEIEDEFGDSARGEVIVDLVAQDTPALRFAAGDGFSARPGPEEFVLGGTGRLAGTLADLDGDFVAGFGPGTVLELDGVAAADLTLEAERERVALTEPLTAEGVLSQTVGGLLGGATFDGLADAFIGDTLLTVTDGAGGSAVIRFSGALLGSFDVTASGGAAEIRYTPTAEGDGTVAGTPLSDDLRGGAGADAVTGADGDDVLLARGGADAADGGAGSDALVGGAGPDALTGGADADLFVVGAGGVRDLLVDFDVFEGDRIAIADARFLTLEGAPDLSRLSIQVENDALVLYGDPNDDDTPDDEREPVVALAEFASQGTFQTTDLSFETTSGAPLEDSVAGALSTTLDGPVSWSATSGPASGSLDLSDDGSFTYLPGSGGAISDAFTATGTLMTELGPVTREVTVALTIEVTEGPNIVEDSTGRDILRGTADDDLFLIRGGFGDAAIGRGGDDQFDFTESIANGAVDNTRIVDWSDGDLILGFDLDDIHAQSIRSSSTAVRFVYGPDSDILTVTGAVPSSVEGLFNHEIA